MVEDAHKHGTGRHYVPGCEGCKILNRAARAKTSKSPKEKIREARYNRTPGRMAWKREYMRKYREDPEQRLKQNASAQRTQSKRREMLRKRTLAEQDADFDRLHPEGVKECRGCGLRLPKQDYPRNRSVSSGRGQSCLPCNVLRTKRKYAQQFEAFNKARGIDVWACIYCEIFLDEGAREYDHFVPLSRGGLDEFVNVFPSCYDCNRGVGGKHDRDPWEWLSEVFPNRIPTLKGLFP